MLFTGKNYREYESPILIIRDELGIKMCDLCKEAGCSSATVYDLAYGMTWPVYISNGQIKPHVQKIADILGCSVEELFPLYFCKKREKQFTNNELFLSAYTIKISRNTEISFLEIEFFKKLNDERYAAIPKRTKTMLYLRFFEDSTLEEIANEFHLSRDRVRQIIDKGLRIMRFGKANLAHDWRETESC